MCGGGPEPGWSIDSTTLTTPPVSRPWTRIFMARPRTFSFLPSLEVTRMGFIDEYRIAFLTLRGSRRISFASDLLVRCSTVVRRLASQRFSQPRLGGGPSVLGLAA